MKYKYVHVVEIGPEEDPPEDYLKQKIADAFAEKLMERTTIKIDQRNGRTLHEASVVVLHDDQMQQIDSILNILSGIPGVAPFVKELRRELFEM